MTLLLIFGIITASFTLIAFLRLGVKVVYDNDGFCVKAKVGFISFKLYPLKEETKRKKVKKAAVKKMKPGTLKDFINALPAVKNILIRLKKKLLIKRLTIHYIAGGSDPVSTAMAFGTTTAVISMIMPVFENHFKIRKHDFHTSADFESDKQSIFVNFAISLAVWEALYIASPLLKLVSQNKTRGVSTPRRKEDKQNGKTPN